MFDRAAIGVGAGVGAVFGKLFQQITVGAMDFDAIEARGNRVGGCAAEIGDDRLDLIQSERARFGHVDEGVVHEDLGLGLDGRWRDRRLRIRLQIDMRNTADVPELQKDVSAFGMHHVGHFPPAVDLGLRIDAGRVLVALPFLRNLRAFRNDQSGCRPLGIICRGDIARHEAGAGSVAGQGRHHDPVCQRQGAECVGLEKCIVSHCVSFVRISVFSVRSRSFAPKLGTGRPCDTACVGAARFFGKR